MVRALSFLHPCRPVDDRYAVAAVDVAAASEHQQEHLRQGRLVHRQLSVRQLRRLRPGLTSFSGGACAWSALVPIRRLHRSRLHHHCRIDGRCHARRHDDRHRHQKLLTHLWTRRRDVAGLRLRDVRDPCDGVRDAPRQDPESRRRLVRVMVAMLAGVRLRASCACYRYRHDKLQIYGMPRRAWCLSLYHEPFSLKNCSGNHARRSVLFSVLHRMVK